MMREHDERRRRESGELEDAAVPEVGSDEQTRFSSQGSLPPVTSDELVQKPTASELAFGDEDVTHAPPRGETQKAEGAPAAGNPAPAHWPQLLIDFAANFPEAAKLIAASPKACIFVKEAQLAGAKYAGFAEDGPGFNPWPYSINEKVYIPKAHADGLQTMSDFLFELNNAIRAPKFDAMRTEAQKGSKGSLTAETYARQTVELEVEGMLKLGEIWIETKKSANKEKDSAWAAHDKQFFLELYQHYKAGKLTKDQIVEGVLKSKYTEGKHAGKTVEQFYMDQYESHVQRGSSP